METNRMRKAIAILLAVMFVLTVAAIVVDAEINPEHKVKTLSTMSTPVVTASGGTAVITTMVSPNWDGYSYVSGIGYSSSGIDPGKRPPRNNQ